MPKLKAFERLKEAIKIAGAGNPKEAVRRLAEFYELPIGGGVASGGDPDSHAYLYRQLTTAGRIDRKLTPVDQAELQRIASWLYKANPIAAGVVNLIKNYVIGGGFTFQAKNEKIKEALAEHWLDPDNAWNIRQGDRMRDLLIFGEEILPNFVDPVTGHTKLAYIDPATVKEIIPHPQNISVPVKVVLNAEIAGKESEYFVVRKDEDGKLSQNMFSYDEKGEKVYRYKGKNTKGKLVGTCFYSGLNQMMSSTRGYSPLLSSVDWLDAYDRFLFTRVENRAVMDKWVLEAICKGMTPKQIQKFLNTIPTGGKAGQVVGHDGKVELKVLSPNLRASDAKEDAKMVRGMFLSGLVIPEFWLFGQAEDVNKASAIAQGAPTMMELSALQAYRKYCIWFILQFHLDQIDIFSMGNRFREIKDEEREFEVIVPPINVEDLSEKAETVTKVTNFLAVAEMQSWIDKKQAAMIFAEVASTLGQEVKVAEDLMDESIQEMHRKAREYAKAHKG